MSSIEEYERLPFRRYTSKSEVDKAVNVLEGLIQGIVIDGVINLDEIAEFENWFHLNRHLLKRHPFSEMTQYLIEAFADRYISEEEKADILWLCEKIKSSKNLYYDYVTASTQKLHGILHGILADNRINTAEIRELETWLAENDFLSGIYPYDEVCSLVVSVLQDGRVDEQEEKLLKAFFSDFIDTRMSFNINAHEITRLRQKLNISGICVACPEIVFPNRLFCFTGISSRARRVEIKQTIESIGGLYHDAVTKRTDYLIVGSGNNPCWSFSCYGRKVEKAMNMRKAGHPILIVHENDFWDELQNIKG